MRARHDMGGLPLGPIPFIEHPMEAWEARANAVQMALRVKGIGTLDEVRRIIESLGEGYESLTYFERTMHAVAQLVLEHGLLTSDEIARWLEREGAGS